MYMSEFHTYQVKFLPMAIYNKVWRWQYMTRKKIATKIKVFFYRMKIKLLKPKLYDFSSRTTQCE
jgi:hypothetical protein